jgi:hypothetical protein
MDWSVLKVVTPKPSMSVELCSRVLKWNQPSIDFYEKCLHAKAQDEWLGMRLEEEGIENLKNITT